MHLCHEACSVNCNATSKNCRVIGVCVLSLWTGLDCRLGVVMFARQVSLAERWCRLFECDAIGSSLHTGAEGDRGRLPNGTVGLLDVTTIASNILVLGPAAAAQLRREFGSLYIRAVSRSRIRKAHLGTVSGTLWWVSFYTRIQWTTPILYVRIWILRPLGTKVLAFQLNCIPHISPCGVRYRFVHSLTEFS